MTQSELKECPFCGSEKAVIASTSVYWGKCNACNSEHGGTYQTQEQAIEAWNTRHQPTPVDTDIQGALNWIEGVVIPQKYALAPAMISRIRTTLAQHAALEDENRRLRDMLNETGCLDMNGVAIKEGHIVHWSDGGDDLPIEVRINTRWDRIAVVSRNPDIQFTVIDSPCKATKEQRYTYKFGNFIWKQTEKYLTVVSQNEEEYWQKFDSPSDTLKFVEALKGGCDE
ncbi:MAG: Lar family restriction alleviation protein [Alphaproteobacteria bacterium]